MWNYAGISECVVQIIVNIISVIICRALAGYRDKIGESVSVIIPCVSVSTVESYPFLFSANLLTSCELPQKQIFLVFVFFSFFTLVVFFLLNRMTAHACNAFYIARAMRIFSENVFQLCERGKIAGDERHQLRVAVAAFVYT